MTQLQWDEVRVARWLGKIDALEAQLQPVSDALFDAAALAPGMAVLEVGCGAGSTTRRGGRGFHDRLGHPELIMVMIP